MTWAKEKLFVNKNSKYKIISRVIVFLYALVLLYMYVAIKAYAVDENTFFRTMKSIRFDKLSDIFYMPNYYGYGQLYWWILKALSSFLVIRVFMWIMLISVPVSVSFTMKKINSATDADVLGALILYICCPMSWFTGKIIGPEIIGMAFGAWGSFLSLYGRKRDVPQLSLLGGSLIGIATGFKIYYFIFMGFVGLYVMLKTLSEKRWRWDCLVIGMGG